MRTPRLFLFIFAAVALLMAVPAVHAAVAPGAALPAASDEPPHADPPARPAPDTGCRLKGVVVCSEYGARQKEDLVLILTDGQGYRHDALIYKDDGTFYTRIPCSGTYSMRIELGDGGIDLGEITLPAADTNSTYDLRIVHPGSMLELILEARTSSESDLTFREPVVVPPGGY